MRTTPELLHPEVFMQHPLRHEIGQELEAFLHEAADNFAEKQPAQPDFTVAIQSCDDTPEQVERLFGDLWNQEYRGNTQRLFLSAQYLGQDEDNRRWAEGMAKDPNHET